MDYQFPCPACGTLNDINYLQCINTSCRHTFTPAVNVKYALTPEEVAALESRYEDARIYLASKALTREGLDFERWVLSSGQAVVNMDFAFLWEWLMLGSKEYQGYKRSVAQGDRLRKIFANDRMRSAVEGLIFGSHEDIIYGALTLNEVGLTSYGKVSVVLQTAAIEQVTSMLDENSYNFIKRISASGWFMDEPFPPGHFATWDGRNKLALAKCHPAIKTGLTFADAVLLIMSAGASKPEDEFIELYIYGKINKSAVEKIKFPVDLRNSFNGDELDQYEELKRHYIVEEY